MLQKPRILVAENEADLAELIRFELDEDFEVYTAQTGDQALVLASRVHPRMVLINPKIPAKNMHYLNTLLTHVSKSEDIVWLTSENESAPKIDGFRFLELKKPLSLHRLPEVVLKLLQNQENYGQSGI